MAQIISHVFIYNAQYMIQNNQAYRSRFDKEWEEKQLAEIDSQEIHILENFEITIITMFKDLDERKFQKRTRVDNDIVAKANSLSLDLIFKKSDGYSRSKKYN